jgi:dihydroorotase
MNICDLLIVNARLGNPEGPTVDIAIRNGVIRAIGPELDYTSSKAVYANGATVLPGLVDVHVHFREPGFEYKETIKTGAMAAAAGGFTTVCTMPNLKPVPDTMENLRRQLDPIARDAVIEVIPYGSITMQRMGQELVDYPELAPYVCAFSDDGTGIESAEVMEEAMRRISRTGKILAEHCEVMSLVRKGCIHDGEYAHKHELPGICSESEWKEVERNIALAEKTGCRLHICHVSTKESVELIRQAKERGVDVTAETGAHYIAFCDKDLQDEGRFKMNPPLRTGQDRDALIRGIQDGTIDCIASDHAPHSQEEKSRGLLRSAMGVTGIELSLAAVYTYAVKTGLIPFDRMVDLMARNPRRIFGIKGGLGVGHRADLTIVDFTAPYTVDPETFLSMGKATPFAGRELFGRVMHTIYNGTPVYNHTPQ